MIEIVNTTRSYDSEDRRLERYAVNLFYCTRHRAEETGVFSVNTAGSYALFYLLTGRLRLENEEAVSGDMIFFSKLSGVSVCAEEGSRWLCVMFDYSHRIPLLDKREYRLVHATTGMRELAERLYSSSSYRFTMIGAREATLMVILNEANQIACSESKSTSLYERACDWIEQNATRAISVQDAANAMGCTREHLNRVFRRTGGQSVGAWIAKARVWEIEQLCRVSDLSLSDIARRLEFSSVELLCKFFRYHKGMSLSQYRLTNP